MELTSRIEMTRFQTFWIRIRKNKPLDESRKTAQTSGTKWHFTLKFSMKTKYLKKSAQTAKTSRPVPTRPIWFVVSQNLS
ncbi:hypothetical protein Hanom_Chr03g00232091 [Helianthus anomalus]